MPAGQVHAPCIHDQLHQLQADPWFLNAQLLQLECRSEYCLIGSGLWYKLVVVCKYLYTLIGYGPQDGKKKEKKREFGLNRGQLMNNGFCVWADSPSVMFMIASLSHLTPEKKSCSCEHRLMNTPIIASHCLT